MDVKAPLFHTPIRVRSQTLPNPSLNPNPNPNPNHCATRQVLTEFDLRLVAPADPAAARRIPALIARPLANAWKMCLYSCSNTAAQQVFGISIAPNPNPNPNPNLGGAPMPVYDSNTGRGLNLHQEIIAVSIVTKVDGLVTLQFSSQTEWLMFTHILTNLKTADLCFTRLRGLARDMIYAGAYTTVPETVDINLPETVSAGLKALASLCPEESLPPNLAKARGVTKKRKRVETPSPEEEKVFGASCVYCDSSDTLSVHPYVPCDFEGRAVEMCGTCIGNWQEHRDKAKDADGRLIPADEENEEICAICSAIPPDLVLCGTCPRSFCRTCLQSVLSTVEYEVMQKVDDWRCMVCHSQSTQNKDGQLASRRKRRGSGSATAMTNSNPTLHASSQEEQPVASKTKQSKLFAAYVRAYCERSKQTIQSAPSVPKKSEDVCGVCKDGGSLIECDYGAGRNREARCAKVYHVTCLRDEVSQDPAEKWTCPRHSCTQCPTPNPRIRYRCKYCPTALCAKHTPESYGVYTDKAETGKVISIVCSKCYEQLQTCITNGLLEPKFRPKTYITSNTDKK